MESSYLTFFTADIKKGIDLNIEALRGFCALMVLVHHSIIFSSRLDPNFEFRKAVIPYAPSGHLMVLVFFVLSGYVIGLNHLNRKFILFDYIKRRFVRLYPIYIIAILIAVLLFSEKWQSILGTAFFVQNLFSDVLKSDMALWSLNHEVIFYILVIPILIHRIRPSIVFFSLALLLGASLIRLQFPRIIEGYFVGFLFWLTGFVISKIKLNQQSNFIIDPNKLISLFLLLLGCDFLNPLGQVFSRLHFLHGTSFHFLDGMVNISDFSAFPFCLYAIVTASSTNLKLSKLLTTFVYLLCWSYLIFLVINGSFFKVNFFYTPAFFLFLSTLLLLNPVLIFKSTTLWAKAGSISYAMYVIHLPLLYFIGEADFFNGNLLTFIVRFLLLCLMVVTISYLLEKRLQPYVKQFFKSPKLIV